MEDIMHEKIRDGNANASGGVQYLTFTIMDEEYGVDIMAVREIKGWTPTTRLPNSPDYMMGVINLRGAIIPIFDLRARFEKGKTEPSENHVYVILTMEERDIGILVDSVSDILTLSPSEIRPAPDMDDSKQAEFIKGLISVEERMVVLLDVAHVFSAKDLKAASQVAEAV